MGELIRHYGPALLAWAVVMVRLALHPRGPTNAMSWVVMLAIAVTLTAKAPPVYHGLSVLTGIPNVARLLDHGGFLVAGWGGLTMLLQINHPADARRRAVPHAIWIAVAFTGMCVLFAVAKTPVDHVRFAGRYGATAGVLEYWLVYIAGLLPTFLTTAALSTRYASMTTDPAVRLGLRLIAAGVLCSVTYHVHKAAYFVARRTGMDYPRALNILLDRYLTLAAAVLILAGLALPNWRTPPPIGNYRKYQRLRPLWLALYRVNPSIALVPPKPLLSELLDVRDLDLRLYRRAVEIRDGRLALRDHIDPRVAARARQAAARSGLTGQKLDAAVEAATLAAAIQAAATGAAPPETPSPVAAPGGRDLDSDIAFLCDVANAFRVPSQRTLL
ncbi:MAB_1171c family putative transporter [Kibdelosporangium phytohabitans]|uniref:DUF6545 domain-containing protein n=1 Tax=Kibdelosporangium phytohabitans TaxID=860235 RepID=A0A0N9I3S3_9PSEU|nr:MAB_1171c family putative transporter [Kibdelosporangium phytohabitans]ALG09436.1 hypothetical protein AOZ06_23255 [Kibdelosporangium phytohabitans]MBE1469279.1 hypothetical protein [Kibdelosporangium phytohabitans]